jgi:hypothetical protein
MRSLRYELVLIAALSIGGCTASSLTSVQEEISSVGHPQAITTSFADAKNGTVLPDTFGNNQTFQPLSALPEQADGSVLLRPGFFETQVRSYCLHAGAAGPTKGDGYLYAPLKGPSTSIIEHVLSGTYARPQIPQSDVQTLIWAILAHTKLGQLPSRLQVTAAQLLSPSEIAELETGGLPALEQAALAKLVASAPPSVQEGLAFENTLRAALVDASTTYAELERIAVPPPLPLSAASVPLGRWSQHPGGYFVRYKPDSYKSVTVQIYVPPITTSRTPGISRDDGHFTRAVASTGGPAFTMVGDVAVPANTGSQRLAISNVPNSDKPPPPPPNCDKNASDYNSLNYGVPWGTLGTRDGHNPNYDISSNPPGAGGQRDEPVFLSLRPSIDMEFVNGKGGTSISGTGSAQLTGATVFTDPWKPKANPDGTPGSSWGEVVGINAHYSYTKSDGTPGVLTFYIEYLHLISPQYPPMADNGIPIDSPVPCSGLGPDMKNGKKLSPDDLSKRPLIGFEGATQTPHVHVQARLADGSVGGLLKGPLVDPTIVLNGDH